MEKLKVLQKGMFQLNKILNNNKGITLLEVLATLVITSIIGIITMNVFIKGSESAKNINIDSQLRDEADLIMSKFIKTIYTTNQNTIVHRNFEGNNSYIEVTSDLTKCSKDEEGKWKIDTVCEATLKKIGFITANDKTTVSFKNEEYNLQNQNIQILPESKISGDPSTASSYEILLVLEEKTKYGNKTITQKKIFKNTIQPLFATPK
ncbi:type II secretion system protein [Rummeliibacillus stabekisii]|uniref:type II secretion system protein n=1 Tax=Rummeliibacillus stabekisii TaxID=241244 RepID=UPI00203E2293|nr:prepilin-type N-terminal cleavage/methylation domain-containing protein [Rummeliibacillus stabekisii]